MKKLYFTFCLLFSVLLNHAQTDVYGVTTSGGTYNAGTIFKTDITGGNYSKVKDLKAYPQNNSLQLTKATNGNYYAFGSLNRNLNIYKYDTITHETIIVNTLKSVGDTLEISDNGVAQTIGAGLTLAPNGKLYGLIKKVFVI